MLRKILIFLFWTMLVCTGCGTVIGPASLPLPPNFTVAPLGKGALSDAIAPSPDGRLIAFGTGPLVLKKTVDSEVRRLGDGVDQLEWSGDGRLLATAAIYEGHSRLQVFEASGRVRLDAELQGRLTRLRWSRTGKLYVALLEVRTFRFGMPLKGVLLCWDASRPLQRTLVFETTLTPGTVERFGTHLSNAFDFDLAPLEDEILFTRVYAPPAFAAIRRASLFHLGTLKEKIVAELPLDAGQARYGADGENLLICDERGEVRLLEPWAGKVLRRWRGTHIDFAPQRDLLLLDNRLLHDGQVMLELPSESRARLVNGGRQLLVAWRGGLFLVEDLGADVTQPERDPLTAKKLLQLRRLRSLGLIEPDEFRAAYERIGS